MRKYDSDPNTKASNPSDSMISEPLLHLLSLVNPPSFSKCVFSILRFSLPCAAYTFIQCLMIGINVHFISIQEDEHRVAGLGLGLVWLTATVFGTILTLNTGTTVLAAQALGALNYHLVPLYFYRALILRAIQAVVCYIICACSVYIFEILDFNTLVAEAAYECCVFSFLAVIGLTIYDTLKAYVNAHTIFFPIMIIQLFVLTAHWFYCRIFVTTFQLGIKGVTLAFGFSQLTGASILLMYILLNKKFKRTRVLPNKTALAGIWQQFVNELYISSFFILQLLAFMICVLMSGTFSLDQTVSQTFTFNIAIFFFTPIFALSETAMILIGNSLGRKEALRAKNFTRAIITVALLFVVVEMCTVYFLGEEIVRFLSSDENIIQDTVETLFVYIWIMPADFIQMTITSILKGAMRERVGALLSLISFYGIGIGGAFLFGKVLGFSSEGIWGGLGIGIYSMAILASFLLWKTDYESQIRKIDDRLVDDDSKNLDKSLLSTKKDLDFTYGSYISDISVIPKK